MIKIHLIRHGQTDWNATRRVQGQSESVLTPLGKQQAAALGREISRHNIDRAYCSSSVRARETAEQLFKYCNIQVEYLDDLREIHLGPWEGRLYDEIEVASPEDYNHFWQQPHLFSVDGAETFLELQQRGMKVLTDICKHTQQMEVAIVSHGALIKSILCHYEGKHLSRLWDPPRLQNCAHNILQLDNQANGKIIQYAETKIPLS